MSVVVPVWNPGPNLTRCLDSLLGQTMDPADYEIVLVDDGSTDGTAARLDALATEHGTHVRVVHIANSGWPGKPRNVGVAAARGEYVQFVDNDDVLAPDALEALYELGATTDADIVIGKLSSDFRGVNHSVFRNTVTRRTIADFPLVETLTPHKMFRRAFLAEHGIAFPEGPTHLEDQLYVMRAYAKARSVAVLADRPCYFYLRRIGSGRNAGDVAMVPREYYAALEQVLDVIDANVAPGELRDALYRRFYRVELLGRLAGVQMTRYADDYRRDLMAEVRRIVMTRLGPTVHQRSGAATRMQGHLVRAGDVSGLVALAEQFTRVSLHARAHGTRWRGGRLLVEVDAVLHWGDEPLRCELTTRGWALPEAMAPSVPESERLLADAVAASDVELSLVRRADAASFGTTDGLSVRVDGTGLIRVSGAMPIDPATAMGGRPLTPGVWDARLRLRFAGWSLGARLTPGFAGRSKFPPALPQVLPSGTVIAYWTRPDPALALDVGEWSHSLGAAVASESVLTVHRGTLRLALPAYRAPSGAQPDAALFLRHGDTGQLVQLSCGAGPRPDGRVTVHAQLPARPPAGNWGVTMRLGEPGAARPVPLPWRLVAAAGRWRAERAVPGQKLDGSS